MKSDHHNLTPCQPDTQTMAGTHNILPLVPKLSCSPHNTFSPSLIKPTVVPRTNILTVQARTDSYQGTTVARPKHSRDKSNPAAPLLTSGVPGRITMALCPWATLHFQVCYQQTCDLHFEKAPHPACSLPKWTSHDHGIPNIFQSLF